MTSPDIDARIRGTAWRYWNRTLRDTTTVQFDDALQFARLKILELGVTNLSHVGNKVQWLLYREYLEKHKFFEHTGVPYIEQPDEGEYALAVKQLSVVQELGMQRVSTISPEEMERLLENLWVVGSPKLYTDVRLLFEDGTPRRGSHNRQGVDAGQLTRAAKMLQKAYWSRDELLGTSKARWVPTAARKPLRLFALANGSTAWPADKHFRQRTKDLVSFDPTTKITTLTDAGFLYVENFPAEQKAFLARQL